MKWFQKCIRKLFCLNEIPPGDMLIIWKDIDHQITGLCVSANEERVALDKVASVIRSKKLQKLEQITGMQKK